ncbi:MAG: glycosyltransferase [Hahellaceae bacterium]|nr:glycosyltransferase [Hahellaceae bacterium]
MLPVELLVSTMNYEDGKLDPLLLTVPDDVSVIVVNQVPDAAECPKPFHIRPNVVCHSYRERGLSKSRNRLMSLATQNYLVISDDDVAFLPGVFKKIADAFERYPEDVLTFQMETTEGRPRKRYKAKSFVHNRLSVGRVSSCEIGLRRQSIRSRGVQYDERFGLGAQFPVGEEVIFLKDCLGAGLRLRFVPLSISSHPEESTGRFFTKTSEFNRGALFQRLFGRLAMPLGLVFYARKKKELAGRLSYWEALGSYLKGGRFYEAQNASHSV